MPFISELNIYPIKSCAGIALHDAILTSAGLMTQYIYDREWMVIDEHGSFLTQRECPQMALIAPRLKADTLELRAPGMLRLEIPLDLPAPEDARIVMVRIWNDSVPAYDGDDTTAAWFSNALGRPCRLVRFHPDAKRSTETKWIGDKEAPALFADAYPLLLISSASLNDLNQRLVAHGRESLPMNRFRPNIVIGGTVPYEEDHADTVSSGKIIIKPVKPCARCPIPSIDQSSGRIGADPLEILSGYRANPGADGGITFGMNAIIIAGAGHSLQVGQEVQLAPAW